MKRTLSMLLALVLILSLIPATVFAADPVKVTLTADKTEVAAGEEIVLTLSIDQTITDAYIWQWNIMWNSELFEAVSMEKGTAYKRSAVNVNATTPLPAPYKASSVTSGNSLMLHNVEAGTLCTLKLKAKTDITADTNAKFYADYVRLETGVEDENFNIIGTLYENITTDYEWGSDYKAIPADTAAALPVPVKAPVAVTGIQLNQTELSLKIGETGTLTATVIPENAADKTVTWSSSDASVATVADGVVTAVAAGSVTITAKASDQTASCTVTVAEAAPAVAAYTVTMGEDKAVVVNETVSVPVTVGHTTDVATYNAFDMTFSYDASILELTSTEIEGMTITAGNGTVRVQGYGADRAVGTTPFSLSFKALSAGTANVTVTSAKVDISANAIDKDAPEATKLDATTQVTVSSYPVTLPESFNGNSVAVPGENYTFSEPTDYYDYTVTVMVGGVKVDVTDNGDGTYTIPAEKVTGEIVITAEKTGKIFNVTLGADMTGNATAQYMTPYTATLTAAEGYTYEVSVTIGGQTYTGYSVAEGVYTIPGADITGEIVFTVVKTALPPTVYNVTFEGNGAGDASGLATVEKGKSYMFRVPPVAGYTYTVTAAINGTSVKITNVGATGQAAPGTYGIAAADITGDIVITVTKTADLSVAVSQYVELDGKTVFLVTASGTLAEGKAYAYDGNAMFYSDVYKTWCHLVIADSAFNADAAKEKVAATETSYITLTATSDVNMSGLVDINDAQLVYDIYNGKYEDFSIVVMQKFLNADVNGDKMVNVTDAAAVVAAIQ